MKPDAVRNEEARRRFLRDARAAAALKHDHVVPIHQVDEDGGTSYLMMPLLRGDSLEARWRHWGNGRRRSSRCSGCAGRT